MQIVDCRQEIEQQIRERSAANLQVPFFERLGSQKLALLAELCQICDVPPNQIIFSEGEEGQSFYIVSRGEVTVKTKSTQIKLGPGAYFVRNHCQLHIYIYIDIVGSLCL